jgi:hypothetical protein
VANAGATEVFKIDNRTPPGGDQRTIGYWKNWNSCTGGGQLDNALAAGDYDARLAAGKALLNDALQVPMEVGLLTLIADPDPMVCNDDTQTAVYLLDKRDVSGRHKKMAGDAAYGLAAQYVGAKANYAVNAGQCAEATAAINQAQELLFGIGFDGTGDYFKDQGKKSVDEINGYYREQANYLAGVLDDYNNGMVCY